MGYETKLVVGYLYGIPDDDGTICEIACLDLSKAGYRTATGMLLSRCRQSDEHYSFFSDDGSTRVIEDRYGDKLTAVPMDELISAMEDDNIIHQRRFSMALPLLRAIRDDPSWDYERPRMRVLQFGY